MSRIDMTIRIMVSSEAEKVELLQGAEHIHSLIDLDTDIPGANILAHLHFNPDLITVDKQSKREEPNKDARKVPVINN